MASDGPKEGFAFVIDTDLYAGNFEREMCAYLTGQIGECEVGEDFVETLPIDFDSNIQQVADDNGCCRPCSIWQGEKTKQYSSVAIFFDTKPSKEQIELMKERAGKFSEARDNKEKLNSWYTGPDVINILGFRLIEFKQKNKSSKI